MTLGGICQCPTYLSDAGKEAVQKEFRNQIKVFVEAGLDFLLQALPHAFRQRSFWLEGLCIASREVSSYLQTHCSAQVSSHIFLLCSSERLHRSLQPLGRASHSQRMHQSYIPLPVALERVSPLIRSPLSIDQLRCLACRLFATWVELTFI